MMERKARIEKRLAPIVGPIKDMCDSVTINNDGSISFTTAKKTTPKVPARTKDANFAGVLNAKAHEELQ